VHFCTNTQEPYTLSSKNGYDLRLSDGRPGLELISCIARCTFRVFRQHTGAVCSSGGADEPGPLSCCLLEPYLWNSPQVKLKRTHSHNFRRLGSACSASHIDPRRSDSPVPPAKDIPPSPNHSAHPFPLVKIPARSIIAALTNPGVSPILPLVSWHPMEAYGRSIPTERSRPFFLSGIFCVSLNKLLNNLPWSSVSAFPCGSGRVSVSARGTRVSNGTYEKNDGGNHPTIPI